MGRNDIRIYYCKMDTDLSKSEKLHLAANLYLKEKSCPPTDVKTVHKNKWGKPYFPNSPQVNFSISHSGDYWICGFSQAPLGLDLQEHRKGDYARLSQRFFHPLEDIFLKGGNYEDFFSLWTAKESYVKYIGTGFIKESSSFSVIDNESLIAMGKMERVTFKHLTFIAGYSLCVCSKRIDEVKISSLSL
ncbi:MAG: 4'-phosphopantetheinyl transferase family protein [Anaerovoracaceae bacterium]|jgi:4'-phosphopantetheinyl transferase